MYNITKSYYHVLSILSYIYIEMCIASTFHSWYFAWNYQRLTPHTNHPFCLKFFEPIGFVLTYPYHVVRPIINFIYEVYHSQVITTFLWDFNHPQSCSHGVSGFTRFTKVYRPFSSQPRGNAMMQASLNVLEDQKEFSTSVRSQVGIPWPNLQLVPLEKKVAHLHCYQNKKSIRC